MHYCQLFELVLIQFPLGVNIMIDHVKRIQFLFKSDSCDCFFFELLHGFLGAFNSSDLVNFKLDFLLFQESTLVIDGFHSGLELFILVNELLFKYF